MVRDDDHGDRVPDDELVRRCLSGDEGAFGVLVRRHHAVVYRLAHSLVQDQDTAEDVTQDAFLKAYQGLGRFRGDASFRTWLLTIAANEARGALRKRKRRRESSLDDAGPVADPETDPSEEAVMRTEAARAREALAQLPEKQRLSVSLRVEDGLSYREIGAVIGSSEGAARVNYFHGIRRLRELMR